MQISQLATALKEYSLGQCPSQSAYCPTRAKYIISLFIQSRRKEHSTHAKSFWLALLGPYKIQVSFLLALAIYRKYFLRMRLQQLKKSESRKLTILRHVNNASMSLSSRNINASILESAQKNFSKIYLLSYGFL